MTVYLLSGIGADRRLFRHITLPPGFEPHHLDWIDPQKNEPLSAYALRLSQAINPDQPFILIGLSLGGIIAVEIAKTLTPKATIIIGSCPVSAQLPLYYKIARKTQILNLVPAATFKLTATLKRLVARETLADKRALLPMIWQGSSRFIKWGMTAVLHWHNDRLPTPLYHLHGTRDEVFPRRYLTPTHTIRGGSHMLVLSHPDQVNKILRDILSPYN